MYSLAGTPTREKQNTKDMLKGARWRPRQRVNLSYEFKKLFKNREDTLQD